MRIQWLKKTLTRCQLMSWRETCRGCCEKGRQVFADVLHVSTFARNLSTLAYLFSRWYLDFHFFSKVTFSAHSIIYSTRRFLSECPFFWLWNENFDISYSSNFRARERRFVGRGIKCSGALLFYTHAELSVAVFYYRRILFSSISLQWLIHRLIIWEFVYWSCWIQLRCFVIAWFRNFEELLKISFTIIFFNNCS